MSETFVQPPKPTTDLSRRLFLRRTALATAGITLSPLLGQLGCSNTTDTANLPWGELSGKLTGDILFPGSAQFTPLSAPWNLRYLGLQIPQAVARCTSAQDIAACIRWAIEHNVPFVARSGGHSYAGYSQTTGLIIDLSEMKSVSLDPTTGIARVGGGSHNSTVYAALRSPKRAITHGRCLEVGVAGLVLGGGIGFNMRAHGLTCDQLIETEIVLASGEVLTCNAQQNSDLFWACKGGGGGNFGIHSSFTFQTFPVSTVTVYKLTWKENQRLAFEQLAALLPTTPNTLGCKVSVHINSSREIEVVLLGQLVGSESELNALLAPITVSPSIREVQTLDYWDGQTFLSEDGKPEYSHERSRYIFEPLSSVAIDTIFTQLQQMPGTSLGAMWKFFLTGGAIDRVSPEATAYVHRNAIMLSSIELEWTTADSAATVAQNQVWLDNFHQAMRPFTSGNCYQNFIDDSQTDYLQAYYGSNLPRLVEVKKKYDPQNRFRYRQSIPVQL